MHTIGDTAQEYVTRPSSRSEIAPSRRHVRRRTVSTWETPGERMGGNGVSAENLAKALGWFSIALGAAEVLAPRALGRALGVGSHPGLMRGLGLREIASGVGILSQRRQAPWLWSRVAGDAMDLALLGTALKANGNARGRVAFAAAAVAGVAALDYLASQRMTEVEGTGEPVGALHVEKGLTVAKSPEECYALWRDLERLPRFMRHLESVTVQSPTRSHWVAKGPAGFSVEWDSEITEDTPSRAIAWRSAPDAQVVHSGVVTFEPARAGRGTIVRVQMDYAPPGGVAGAMIAKLFGDDPQQAVLEDLRRFKQLLEAGEIPTTQGQPAGKRGVLYSLLKKGHQR